jgi:preprotein translocase subunit SecY
MKKNSINNTLFLISLIVTIIDFILAIFVFPPFKLDNIICLGLGVIPVIFASSLLAFPQTIAIFMGKDAQAFITKYLSPQGEPGFWIYLAIQVVLIIFFSYFYTTISFNTEDITNNMKNSGGFIPGIRPGKPTMDYLNRILSRLTLAGAIFLAVIATIPSIGSKFTAVHLSMAGTSLLIVVGVALELKRQLESNLVMRTYQGFLK